MEEAFCGKHTANALHECSWILAIIDRLLVRCPAIPRPMNPAPLVDGPFAANAGDKLLSGWHVHVAALLMGWRRKPRSNAHRLTSSSVARRALARWRSW